MRHGLKLCIDKIDKIDNIEYMYIDKSLGWPRGAELHSHQVIVGICGLWVSKNLRMMEVG